MTTAPCKLLHISDFHVSTFGETFHDRSHFVERSGQPVPHIEDKYESRWEENGWRIVVARSNKPKDRNKLVLFDAEGYEHEVTDGSKDGKTRFERMMHYARQCHVRQAQTMAAQPPTLLQAQALLQETPSNTNVRLSIAVEAVRAENPDWIVMSGDLTDHGDGYELISALFSDWISRGRVLAVCGNHDRYLFPFSGNSRPKPTRENKRNAWEAFAKKLGLHLDETGAWFQEIPDAQTVVIGLDSCATGQSKFLLHTGEIGEAQLHFLRGIARTSGWQNAVHRIVVMHHHLVPLSYGVGKGGPTEMGMRLDDAVEVAKVFNQIGVTLVLHGHRHISEARQPAGCNFQILSAPSLTLGCHSGDAPSFWSIELGAQLYWRRVRVPLTAWNSRTQMIE